MTKTDVLRYKYYITGDLVLNSPLILGSGQDNFSDNDLARNWSKDIIFPASTIAGVSKHFLNKLLKTEENEGKKVENEIIRTVFGESDKDSTQSLIIFYDCKDFKDLNINIRDGVNIDYDSRVVKKGAKFDYEIIEPGAFCIFRLELEIRAGDNKAEKISKIESLLCLLLDGFINEKIRIGAKTARGFGKVQLCNCQILKLNLLENKGDRNIWINFQWNDWNNWDLLKDFKGLISFDQLNKEALLNEKSDLRQTKIEVDFEIPHSILIRSANPDPEGEDVSHILSNNNPVIPGPSWAGALQNGIHQVLRSIKKVKAFKHLLDDLFGFAIPSKDEEDYQKRAKKSRIFISESIIESSKLNEYTRNKIDRFTGGTVETALFIEKSSYCGSVQLNIMINDCDDSDIGLVLLGIKELWYGLQPIGGAVSIGRGILEGKELKIEGKPYDINSEELNKYYSAIILTNKKIKLNWRDKDDY